MSSIEEMNDRSLMTMSSMMSPPSSWMPSRFSLDDAYECALEVLATPCPHPGECEKERLFVREVLKRLHARSEVGV